MSVAKSRATAKRSFAAYQPSPNAGLSTAFPSGHISRLRRQTGVQIIVPADHAAAIDRVRQHGVEVVTSEMVLFEWLRDARHPSFRQVHKLLK